MGPYTTKPIKELSLMEFKELVRGKGMIISPHALDHLSNRQRKVFNKEELISMVEKESPRRVYLQENGRCGAYYRKKDGYRKLILEVTERVVVVSFIDTQEMPR